MRLAVRQWGDPAAPRVVFLHGVTSHGAHVGPLAEGWLVRSHHVLAPDLLGHGSSPYEPPWSIHAHLAALAATLEPRPATWIGHSFGARLALEFAAGSPGLVERLVLLDPAIALPPHAALFAAENARAERVYGSFDEAVTHRYEESSLAGAPRELVESELAQHLAIGEDGRWRYRYCQAAVVAAYGELASTPPPFSAARVPTLVVLGERSYLPYDGHLERHRQALGGLLRVATVPGGHTVLWDSLEETAAVVSDFLGAT